MAALLAAGAGSRYIAAGGEVSHKLLALVDGVPVWHRALAAVVSGPFDHIVVVTRWFGGKHLGGDRFRHVQEAVRLYIKAL